MQFVRNFAVMGIPFFGLGLFVKKYEFKFQAIPNYAIFASVIIGAFESVVSRCFLGENELHIGSLLILFAMVCTFTKYAEVKYPSFLTDEIKTLLCFAFLNKKAVSFACFCFGTPYTIA